MLVRFITEINRYQKIPNEILVDVFDDYNFLQFPTGFYSKWKVNDLFIGFGVIYISLYFATI